MREPALIDSVHTVDDTESVEHIISTIIDTCWNASGFLVGFPFSHMHIQWMKWVNGRYEIAVRYLNVARNT